ncbi:MAG: lysylphosphatidylglycerol synthase transmembrane domain-containing protein, partial [Candidatus Promineifilaceae bacterium]
MTKPEPITIQNPSETPEIRVSRTRIIIGLLIGAAALYLIVRNIDFGDVVSAFQSMNSTLIILAFAVILITIVVKTWRWYLIFAASGNPPSFRALFWALVTGQFFNAVIPLRTGEIARVLSLDQQENISKSKTLSTLVIEKTLDILGLLATIVLLLPFITLPKEVTDQGGTLAIILVAAVPILLILLFSARYFRRVLVAVDERLPSWMNFRMVQILDSGLEGLAALRSGRGLMRISGVTFLIVLLSVLTPLILFRAFSLPYGLREAIILNLLVTAATAPPSTPGRVIVFLAIVRLALEGLGAVDSGLVLSYAIAFLVIVYTPSLILGGIALA